MAIAESALRASMPLRVHDARRDSIFYGALAIVATIVVFGGFAPAFFLRAYNADTAALRWISLLHGAVFAGWMAFFVLQNLPVARERPGIRHGLALAGICLAIALVVMGFAMSVYGLRHGYADPLRALPDRETSFALPFFDLVVFAPLAGATFLYRNRPELYRRLLLMATIGGLMYAAAGTMPFGATTQQQLAIYSGMLLAGPMYDLLTRQQVHPVYFIGLVPTFILIPPTRIAIGMTSAWHRFAQSFM